MTYHNPAPGATKIFAVRPAEVTVDHVGGGRYALRQALPGGPMTTSYPTRATAAVAARTFAERGIRARFTDLDGGRR